MFNAQGNSTKISNCKWKTSISAELSYKQPQLSKHSSQSSSTNSSSEFFSIISSSYLTKDSMSKLQEDHFTKNTTWRQLALSQGKFTQKLSLLMKQSIPLIIKLVQHINNNQDQILCQIQQNSNLTPIAPSTFIECRYSIVQPWIELQVYLPAVPPK